MIVIFPPLEQSMSTTPRPLSVRIFYALQSSLAFLASGCGAAYRGIWLGLLDDHDLRRITEDWYSKNPQYQAATYDRSGLTTWERDTVERFFGNVRRVLIGACGGGREAIALAERGFEVDAFDCNRDLVACSRQMSGLSTRIFYADPDHVPDDLGTYDGFIMGWGAYSHILPRAARVRFLHAIKAHLHPSAPVLLSFMIRTTRGEIKFRLTRAIANCLRTMRLAPKVELGDSLSETLDHHFNRAELESELREAGFEPCLYSEEFYGHAVATAGPTRTVEARESTSAAVGT